MRIKVLSVLSVAIWVASCAGGLRIGTGVATSEARESACTFWCDSHIDALDQDGYFACLERCVEWRCR